MILARLIFAAGMLSDAGLASPAAAEVHQNRLNEALELEDRGDLEGAKRILRQIAELARQSQTPGIVLPAILCKLGSLEQDQTHYLEAERLYKHSVELWRSLPGGRHIGLAQSLNNLASVYYETGRKALAEDICRQSLSIRLELQGPRHPDVALEYSNLAANAYRQKRYKEAESWAWKAVEIWDRLPPEAAQSDLAYVTLALIYSEQLRNNEAFTFAKRAIEREQQKPHPKPLLLASYVHTLARVYMKLQQWKDAEARLQEALAIFESAPEISTLERYGLLADYSVVLRRTKRKTAARKIEKQIKMWDEEIVRANGLRLSVDVETLHR